MRKRNGHRLRKLKDRLAARALNARRERMKRGGTWRQDMVTNLNGMFGKVTKVVNNNQNLNDKRHKGYRIVLGAQTSVMLFLVGRVLGWW